MNLLCLYNVACEYVSISYVSDVEPFRRLTLFEYWLNSLDLCIKSFKGF